MEAHFLSDAVVGLERSAVAVAMPWYNSHGDCIVYQTADEAVIAERIDEFLTIYRSAVDNRPIGFQLKEVLALISAYGIDGLSVESEVQGDQLVSVKALLLAAYERLPVSIHRRKGYAMARLPEFEQDAIAIAS